MHVLHKYIFMFQFPQCFNFCTQQRICAPLLQAGRRGGKFQFLNLLQLLTVWTLCANVCNQIYVYALVPLVFQLLYTATYLCCSYSNVQKRRGILISPSSPTADCMNSVCKFLQSNLQSQSDGTSSAELRFPLHCIVPMECSNSQYEIPDIRKILVPASLHTNIIRRNLWHISGHYHDRLMNDLSLRLVYPLF